LSKSEYELELLSQIRLVGLPEPTREFKAIQGRRFKWDFAYPDKKILIEVQGDIWAGRRGEQSGHTSGTGLTRDYEKNNLAILNGWKVLYFSGEMVMSGYAVRVIEEVLK
jgi:very-short-patch-repair endonuclease